MKIKNKTVEEIGEPFPYTPKTSLGKRLLKLRAKIMASGERVLDWEEIEKEVANRRGGLEGGTR